MAYTKQTWNDLPNTTTPVTATRLNHIEDGIYDNSTEISNNTTAIDSRKQTGSGVVAYNSATANTWHKILFIPTYTNKSVVFTINTSNYYDGTCIAIFSVASGGQITAKVVSGNFDVSKLGYIVDGVNIDIYAKQFGTYERLHIQVLSMCDGSNQPYGNWDIWKNGTYPQVVSGTPTFTGNFTMAS